MLTPVILSRIYTKDQLLARLAAAKTRLESYASGDDITSIGEASLNVTYGSGATKEEMESELEAIVEALQILDPYTFGDDLLRPNVKYVY
jgi:hypothetical protein